MTKKIEMPEVAAWVEQLRAAFGVEEINRQIRRGRDGEPVFFAAEAGKTFGTRLPAGSGWNASGLDDRLLEPPTKTAAACPHKGSR
ncbi:hypothetical protein [Paraburkholderia tropica]|uniref:hypothetical protein n=1 Tax=Paraburkholderia tropica TaxID=92647 RepID=UPI001CC5ABD0|nr:hypothetical protein [Paraburkholderia tropica]